MPKRKVAKPLPNDATTGQGERVMGWGGSVKHTRTPSGVKLVLEPDSDCILRYIGRRDISEKVGQEEGTAVVLAFFDGKRIVSMPMSYAFTEAQLTTGQWYYINHQGEIERKGLNPMKDFLILELGVDGEVVECPDRIADSRELILTPENIAQINYNRLNYPLR